MLPHHAPLIWGLRRLGYKGRAEPDTGFELQTGPGLGKRAVQRRGSGRCMPSEGPGKAVVWCRGSEPFGMAAAGQRRAELGTAAGWCRLVVFAWRRLAAEAERAAEQHMLAETEFARGKTAV